MIVVETERLVLRYFRISDCEAMNSIFGDAKVMRFGRGTKTPQEVLAWLHDQEEQYRQNSQIVPSSVVEKSGSEKPIGYCGLSYFPDVNGQPELEIGYRLALPYWKYGYATEAASAVRDYAFNTLGLTRIISLIDPHNVASIRVAEKLGMHHETDLMLEGYTHPDRVYVIEKIKGGQP